MHLVKNALKGCRITPASFSDFSSSNRALYEEVDEKTRRAYIKNAYSMMKKGYSEISLPLFREFLETGDRKHHETLYFFKRRKLSVLTCAEALENEGRFTSEIENGIYSLLSEPAWVIPAHNSYIRDTPQLPTPDISRPVLDLFACESGEILALVKEVLGTKIDPILKKDIEFELMRRIIKPYLEDHFWWMGGCGKLNNWSIWCTQNVLVAALSLPLSEKELSLVIKKAVRTIDLWLDEYKKDGCCDEGASYYHAAGLALFGCLYLLDRVTNGAMTPVFENEKIKNIASYIEKVFVQDDIYLNFADCSPKAGRLSAREFLFAEKCRNEEMMAHARKDYIKETYKGEEDNNYNLFYMLLALSSDRKIRTYKGENRRRKALSFTDFPSVGLTIYREKDITLAVKSGSNDDSHNHNDVGSITLYKGKKPLLIDIGVETYTKKTFSPERYTLFPMKSTYHNTVNFPPIEQKAGKEFGATERKVSPSSISFHLEKAYSDERIESYVRSVFFNRKDESIKVKDETASSLPPCLSIITQEEPEVSENRISFPSFEISFTGAGKIEKEIIEISDQRLMKMWKSPIYRCLVSFEKNLEWVITYREQGEKSEN